MQTTIIVAIGLINIIAIIVLPGIILDKIEQAFGQRHRMPDQMISETPRYLPLPKTGDKDFSPCVSNQGQKDFGGSAHNY